MLDQSFSKNVAVTAVFSSQQHGRKCCRHILMLYTSGLHSCRSQFWAPEAFWQVLYLVLWDGLNTSLQLFHRYEKQLLPFLIARVFNHREGTEKYFPVKYVPFCIWNRLMLGTLSLNPGKVRTNALDPEPEEEMIVSRNAEDRYNILTEYFAAVRENSTNTLWKRKKSISLHLKAAKPAVSERQLQPFAIFGLMHWTKTSLHELVSHVHEKMLWKLKCQALYILLSSRKIDKPWSQCSLVG